MYIYEINNVRVNKKKKNEIILIKISHIKYLNYFKESEHFNIRFFRKL
jgi:hypothetical protein